MCLNLEGLGMIVVRLGPPRSLVEAGNLLKVR